MRVDVSERLSEVRRRMDAAGVGAVIVRGTDRYRSNFVPSDESLRCWLTGFDGGVGDALVTLDHVWLFIASCDLLHAERQVDAEYVTIVSVPFGKSILQELLAHLRLNGEDVAVGFDAEITSVVERAALAAAIESGGGRPVAMTDDLVGRARGVRPPVRVDRMQAVAEGNSGQSTADKLARLRELLAQRGADAMLVTRLEEIAWLTNLRAYELEHSATFRSIAWVDAEAALLFVDEEKVTPAVRKARGRQWDFQPESAWVEHLTRHLDGRSGVTVVVDPAVTAVATLDRISAVVAGRGRIVEQSSPARQLASIKNKREIDAMRDGMRRADEVLVRAVRWLNKTVGKGKGVSERRLADELEALFRAEGARALAFPVIAAAGDGAAHAYGSSPDTMRRVRRGELVLLEAGALFESGYATALCRTLLVGGGARPTKRQKQIYTIVLTASIRGMRARFPRGTTGAQLDAVVRAPLWAEGLDYPHATGSGLGLGVRESPPRIAPGADAPLEPGMVFSIAPGAYVEGWGGVRIGNVVRVEQEPKVEGFLRLRPLTFAPIDRRLIDGKQLTIDDKSWLRRYLRRQV